MKSTDVTHPYILKAIQELSREECDLYAYQTVCMLESFAVNGAILQMNTKSIKNEALAKRVSDITKRVMERGEQIYQKSIRSN